MFILNCWYVAAWASELDAGELLARTIIGHPMLFYRRDDGQIVAMDDRCCHRFAPLSHGRREGDCVRCMYHGMKFDPLGACVEIPGQATIPPNARVRTYPARMHNNWIWVGMGDATRADFALLPDTSSLDSAGWSYKGGYSHFKCDYRLVIDNLLDFSHRAYVHPTTLGGSEDLALSRPTLAPLDCGVRVTWWIRDVTPSPYHQRFGNFSGNVDRWNFYDFLVPGILIMHGGAQATGTGAPEGRIDTPIQTRGCQALTPETERTTHYFFAAPRMFALDDPAADEAVLHVLSTAFAEDQVIIEAQQRNIDLDPTAKPVVIAADGALVQMRRIMDRMLADEAATFGSK